MKDWIRPISEMGACHEALEWAEGYKTINQAWAKCKHGEWMLWLLGKLSGSPESASRKKLVLAACQCARLALPYVKKGEDRPLKAIETAEAWAHGDNNISLQDVRNAADTAADTYAAAYATDYAADAAAYATAAAYAAAYAYDAYAADAAAYAAYAYAYATYAADTAADAFAADTYADPIRFSILMKCADIVREYYPEAPSMESKDAR